MLSADLSDPIVVCTYHHGVDVGRMGLVFAHQKRIDVVAVETREQGTLKE